jgi:hypothetical protein
LALTVKEEYLTGPNSLYKFHPSKSPESLHGVVLVYKDSKEPVMNIPPDHLEFAPLKIPAEVLVH